MLTNESRVLAVSIHHLDPLVLHYIASLTITHTLRTLSTAQFHETDSSSNTAGLDRLRKAIRCRKPKQVIHMHAGEMRERCFFGR